MKLDNLIIGIGVFALFTIIIFGFVNPDNSSGLYSENQLNITVDSNTTKTIRAFSDVGDNTSRDFSIVGDDIDDFTTNRSTSSTPTEGNLLAEGIKVLFAIPTFFGTVTHGLSEISAAIGIPRVFTTWAATSIAIIIIFIMASAFLRNKLQN